MTLKEQIYQFEDMDNHAAIIMQMAIENRLTTITGKDDSFMKKGEKEQRAVLDELAQIYDDLDRHISAGVRRQEYERRAKIVQEPPFT